MKNTEIIRRFTELIVKSVFPDHLSIMKEIENDFFSVLLGVNQWNLWWPLERTSELQTYGL